MNHEDEKNISFPLRPSVVLFGQYTGKDRWRVGWAKRLITCNVGCWHDISILIYIIRSTIFQILDRSYNYRIIQVRLEHEIQ